MQFLHRLALVRRFFGLCGKAREIELEWQKIQQAEHDAFFAVQITGRRDEELTHAYKKGITDGIKWCVEHFS